MSVVGDAGTGQGEFVPPTQIESRQFTMKSALAYSGTNLIAQAIAFLSGFFLRGFLPPELMGVWNRVVVIRGYLRNIGLGIMYGAGRELSLLKGQGNGAEQIRCRSVALSASLIEAVLLACGVWAYALWGPRGNHVATYALVVTGVLVILAQIQDAYVVFFTGSQSYISLSRLLLVTGIVYAIALPIGAIVGGIPGLLAAAVIAEIFRAAWHVVQGRRAGLKAIPMFDVGVWKRLVFYGVGFRLADYPMTFFQSFDLLWITKFAGLRTLGLYAFAVGLYSQASDITSRVGTVLYSRTLIQYGRGVDRTKIADDMLRFMRFQLLISIPLVSWAVASAVPFVIRHMTPMYVESIEVLPVLLLRPFFIPQTNNLFALWIAEKRLVSYGVSNVFGALAVAGAIAYTWFVLGRVTLPAVAWAAVIGSALYFAYMVCVAGRELWGPRAVWSTLGLAALASGWTGAVLQYLTRGGAVASWPSDLIRSVELGALGLFGLIPLFALGLWITKSGAGLYRLVAHAVPVPRIATANRKG